MLRLSCTSYSHCKRWQVIILLHWAEAIKNHKFYFTAWGHIFLHYTRHEYKYLRSFLSYSSSFFSPYICLPTFFLPSPLNVLSSFGPYASKTKIRLWTHLVHLAILFFNGCISCLLSSVALLHTGVALPEWMDNVSRSLDSISPWG